MFTKPKPAPQTGLPFDDLVERKRTIDLEIAARQETEVELLKSKVEVVCDALGITVAELFGIKSETVTRKRKATPKVKYRDPDQPEYTWTGKGKPPKWLQEKLDQGGSKEQFQV